ncbi:MAG: hypothetical protein U9N44_04475 [Chloroflexota bacterium]|nr:hypothetical protein [Chloroflexota bacterium]
MDGKTKRALGVPEALVLIGALAMLVSVFLYWWSTDTLGPQLIVSTEMIQFFILAALIFAAFAAKSRGLLPGFAFIGLGFAGLAVIGNYAYYFFDAQNAVSALREGFYLAGIGSLLVFLGGIMKTA